MKYNNNVRQNTMVGAIAIGCGIGVILTMLGAFAAAYAVSREYLEENQIGYIVMVITGIASTIGSFITIRKAQTKRLPSALAVGAAYYAILLLVGITLFGGPGRGVIVTGILIIGCSGCVSLLCLKGNKRKYGIGRKYVNR